MFGVDVAHSIKAVGELGAVGIDVARIMKATDTVGAVGVDVAHIIQTVGVVVAVGRFLSVLYSSIQVLSPCLHLINHNCASSCYDRFHCICAYIE